MAGEMLLINPRRRRGRRKKTRSHRRAKSSRRRRRLVAANPFRRRRRRGHRRATSRRRRTHRNPRLPLLGAVNLPAILGGATGYVATRYGTGFALSMLPPDWSANPQTAPMVRIGVKAAVGLLVLPFLAGLTPWTRRLKGPLAVGGGIAVAVDLFETYFAKMIPAPMADYENQELTDYEMQSLSGSPTAYGGGAFGNGTFAGAAY